LPGKEHQNDACFGDQDQGLAGRPAGGDTPDTMGAVTTATTATDESIAATTASTTNGHATNDGGRRLFRARLIHKFSRGQRLDTLADLVVEAERRRPRRPKDRRAPTAA
jgi:hypothetical protein